MAISDPVFAEAVAAIEAGDVARLDALTAQEPRLVTDRLMDGAQGYFANPYLLWFVAGNPIREAGLPPNIADVTQAICSKLDNAAPPSRQEQLDYAVALVATGLVPRKLGVQIALIDVLVRNGARPDGLDSAVAHREFDAARRLLDHGAPLTLTAALALGRMAEATALLANASQEEKADALVVAASLGQEAGVRLLIDAGVDPNLRSRRMHAHSSALHQAALSGHAAVCSILLAAGADRAARDVMWNGTPSGWARHGGHEELAQQLT